MLFARWPAPGLTLVHYFVALPNAFVPLALCPSQVFAICAMRSIYTLVSHAISDLPYLKVGSIPEVAFGFVSGHLAHGGAGVITSTAFGGPMLSSLFR